MDEVLTQFEAGSDLNQAVRFHSRERRRSLAGIVDLNRTHRFVGASAMAVATITPADSFPAGVDSPITFRTAVRITGAAPAGLVFELGSSTRGCALAVLGNFIAFVAGGLTTERGFALFNNGGVLPLGLELDLVAAIRPGDGMVRLWGNGIELARNTATDGNFGGGWTDTGLGSFATVKNGTLHPGVIAGDQAPFEFDVIEPLSVYNGQVPQHFV